MQRIVLRAVAVATMVMTAGFVSAAEWDPARFAYEDVLEFRSVSEEGDEHWSKVWLVVLDAELYVRLGSRAVERIEANVEAPYVGIRIADEQFDRVLTEAQPEMVERVSEAMADKYWTDFMASLFEHPLTLKLVEEAGPPED
jgi:hypothetical protein